MTLTSRRRIVEHEEDRDDGARDTKGWEPSHG
jgi:hypothetical protein